MLYYPSHQEDRTWREASDEAWAQRAAAAYAAAAGREQPACPAAPEAG